MPLPGQLKRLPPRTEASPPSKDDPPEKVVREANKRATQAPDNFGYFNAIAVYDYVPGALFQVYTALHRLTDIQLQPGEEVMGKIAIGDNLRWIAGTGVSAVGGVQQQHVYIKPTRPGLNSTLTINTNRRTYLIEIHSYEDDTYMAAVQWQYPQDEIQQLQAQDAKAQALDRPITATNVRVDALNFNYDVKVHKGKPSWTPRMVFDDGVKTFIRFPPTMLQREAPILLVLNRTGEGQIVNYRQKNEYFIVDRLFDAAELRLGQKDADVVRITGRPR